jgi:phosphoenolpyruvate carboxylase
MTQMPRGTGQKEAIFNNEVVSRFELYNSLFLTLPFYRIKDTGTLLPLFIKHCEEGVKNNETPAHIIKSFFDKFTKIDNAKDGIDLLFRFIQYIERQVVLFDAVEDASFNRLNSHDDQSSIHSYLSKGIDNKILKAKIEKLVNEFSLRLVLTAHPTQFYPGSVLSIITDLTAALKINDISSINQLLQQLGKTPFFNKKSPTPVDEALSLAWYLENVFYFAAANIQSQVDFTLSEFNIESKRVIELGFWPGGDRDGNPNVHTDSTIQVVKMLRQILFRCYYRDFRNLKRRITFRGVEDTIAVVQDVLYNNAFDTSIEPENICSFLLEQLTKIKTTLLEAHDGLFVDLVEDLIRKVNLYGTHFASLDIRQDSRILRNAHAYCQDRTLEADDLIQDTIGTIAEIKQIQQSNGELACHRFIISNCQKASDILMLTDLFLWNGWTEEELSIDFVPLFETVDDLLVAGEVMDTLYNNPFYRKHLERRGFKQHIMLGFSDSTKDGGYLMANWSIFKAKVDLTAVSNKHNIELAFFDGRGGPPARGGGKTHRFYASMGKEIANKNIQITIQGQTISSQYGSIDSAAFNMEQLINAGISAGIREKHNILLDPLHKNLLDVMASDSYNAYVNLRQDPLFMSYLEKFSPLTLLSKITISSRPVKRNSGKKLQLEDLRAISFVTSWSQLKQNIPGFYGVGTALKNQEDQGNWDKVEKTYQESGYFKTIVENCMMSMSKTDFSVTAYFAEDPVYGGFWKTLNAEYNLAKTMLLKLAGHESLMENYPVEKRSIAVREKIVLPLVLIQHHAMAQLQDDSIEADHASYEKLAIRTVYGIVNAGRNLA